MYIDQIIIFLNDIKILFNLSKFYFLDPAGAKKQNFTNRHAFFVIERIRGL